jgi:tol-pal system protein YbgF
MRVGRLRLWSAGAGLTLLLAAGCARSAEERQLDSMRDEIDRLQHERDTEDAKTGLLASDEEEAARRSERLSPGRVQALAAPQASDAVSIGFDGDAPADDAVDPEDPAPRPSIRILGSPHASGRGAWRGDDHVEATGTGDAPPAGERPSALDPEAKPAYDAALALVTAHKYPAALEALAAFLVKWPDHPYADNAMYWRGECYFAQGDYAHAAEQFDGVVTRFPAGNKAPDALLKLGMCAARTGDTARARDLFARLARDYPQSTAARRIPPVPSASGIAAPGPSPEDHR